MAGARAAGRTDAGASPEHGGRAVVARGHRGASRDGSLIHDFRDFDRFVETFQAAGVDRLFCLSHVGGRTTEEWECPTMSSNRHTVRRLESGEQEQIDVIELLPALQRHLEAKGWLDRFVLHVADEPIAKNVESYRQLAARARQAAPRPAADRRDPRAQPAGVAGDLRAAAQLLRAVARPIPCRSSGPEASSGSTSPGCRKANTRTG